MGLTGKALTKGTVTVRRSNGSPLDLIAHRFAIAASCCDNILEHVEGRPIVTKGCPGMKEVGCHRQYESGHI